MGFWGGVAGYDYAVGFKVSDAVVGGVAQGDSFAKYRKVAAGVLGEVPADRVVVVHDEDVGGFALGAVDGVFEGAVERRRWQWCHRVGSGTDCGDDQTQVRSALRG